RSVPACRFAPQEKAAAEGRTAAANTIANPACRCYAHQLHFNFELVPRHTPPPRTNRLKIKHVRPVCKRLPQPTCRCQDRNSRRKFAIVKNLLRSQVLCPIRPIALLAGFTLSTLALIAWPRVALCQLLQA